MTIRISELNELSADLSQLDLLPIVDVSAGETKNITTGNFLSIGISGAPSSFIDLSKLNQNSSTKLSYLALDGTGVASGVYGNESTVASFVVNSQGLITAASGVVIVIPATNVTGLAPVATSGTYQSLSGLPSLGTISSQNADSIVISGGTIAGVVFSSNNVTIGGGTISGITDLAIEDGGTGASDASTARSNLGLTIGTNVQAYSPVLSGVVEKFNDSDLLVYSSASGVIESAAFTSLARSIVSGETASGVRTTLGLGSIAVQDADSIAISGGTIANVSLASSAVDISGGTISGITDLAIGDGGTGASSAGDARTNLGLAIGSDVQAYSPVLSGVASSFTGADELIYASASGVVSSTPFTSFARSIVSGGTAGDVRATLGLGTIAVQDAGSVVISGGTIGGVTLSASDVTISGGTITAITDLAIEDGGTGASSASDARTNLGLAVGSDVQAYSPVLDGLASGFDAADLVAYSTASGVVSSAPFTSFARSIVSGTTAGGVRTTLGLGSLSTQNADDVAINGGSISNVTLNSGSVAISGGTISGITDLAIADGGTGASSASDARTNLGLAIGSDVQAFSTALSGITVAASGESLFFYTTSSGVVDSAAFSAAARGVVAAPTISGMRSELGLGSVATLDEIVISSGNIAPDAVTTNALLDESVSTEKIAVNAVSLSRLDIVSSDVLLGRATAGSGNVETIPCTAAARSLLDDETIADIRETLGLGELATQDGTFSGTSTGTNTGDQTITLTGDVTGTGDGAFATSIASAAVTEDKIAESAVTSTKLGGKSVTASKLGDDSTVIVSAATPTDDGAFIGQQWVNTNTGFEYTWTGTVWQRLHGIADIAFTEDGPLSFAVVYPDNFSAQIEVSYDIQPANTVWAGPVDDVDASPSFRALTPADLPVAASGTKGIIQPGTGLVTVEGVLNHSNVVSGQTINGITFDNEGHISAAVALAATDIPELDAAKITTGTFGTAFITDSAVTNEKLADYATAAIGETLPVANFIGEIFFNPLDKTFFLWDGNVWQPIGISAGAIVFAGTYDASVNQVASVTTEGAAIGLSVGEALPDASNTNANYYLVVSIGGTGTAPAPTVALAPPDLLLSNGASWLEIDVSSTFIAQSASNVAFSPAGQVGSTNVQAAIEEVSSECRNADNLTSGTLAAARGGTGNGSYVKGDLLVASGATSLERLGVGSNGQVLRANSATVTGLEWGTDFVGTVTTVSSSTAALTVANATTTPALTLRSATTSVNGIVQLSDSTSTTSSVLAATPTAVKAAFDLANAALPKAGGTVTGQVLFGTAGSLVFEGSTNDAFKTTLAVADPTASRTITLPNLTGTVALVSQLDDGAY